MMPNQENAATFQACTGDVFRTGPVDLVLSEVHPLPGSPNAPRPNPFSLLFLGPPKPILPQATYSLAHDKLGALAIFIVPVGPNPKGQMQYEAVFN